MKVVGAALKKIAVALVSNPQNWKTIGGIILALIIVVITPIAAVVAILNGNIEIDQNRLNEIVQQNITAEQSSNLEMINTTMEKVEQELEKRNLLEYKTQAEVLYVFSLTEHSNDEKFVRNFVKCFGRSITDEQLVERVNQKFGTEIQYEEFKKMMDSIGNEVSEQS
jgi:uncharacterized protein YpmS